MLKRDDGKCWFCAADTEAGGSRGFAGLCVTCQLARVAFEASRQHEIKTAIEEAKQAVLN